MAGRNLEILNDKTIELIVQEMVRHDDYAVDLDSLKFVDPFGLLSLLVLGREIHRMTGQLVPLTLPKSEELLHYLVRMDFPSQAVQWFESRGEVRVPAEVHRRREAGMVLLEITPIVTALDVLEIVQLIQSRLKGILETQLGYDAEHVHKFAVAVSELCQNIPDHAGSPGLVAVQRYTVRSTGSNFVKIAVADGGVGIRRSLEPRYGRSAAPTGGLFADAAGTWSDEDALKTAFERGVSRVEDPGRGQGLKRVREMVRDWGGNLLIRSGTARLQFRGATARRQTEAELSDFPGTQLLIELPALG